MPRDAITLVELCAGTASVSLYALAGVGPLTGMMGSKRGDRERLTRLLLGGCVPDRVVLVDAGPWGDCWLHLRDADTRREVAAVLRAWGAAGSLVDVWPWLVQCAPPDDPARRVAQYLCLQARQGQSTAVWWDGLAWVTTNGRGAVERAHARSWSSSGLVRLATLAERVESLDRIDWSRVDVIHGDVRDVAPIPGSRVLFDPPYLNCPRYAVLLPRADVLAVAERHAAVAALVIVCEAEPLPLAGWRHERLRPAGKPEWLTIHGEAGFVLPMTPALVQEAMPW